MKHEVSEQTQKLAGMIDHTLLKASAGRKDIRQLCVEAIEHQFFSVCVNSAWVAYCKEVLSGTKVQISAVCGFPLGATMSEVKAYEAFKAVESGAQEIDMVLPVGQLLAGDEDAVYEDIRMVVDAVKGRGQVKVILETGYLTVDQIRAACHLSVQAGAHYVKTSTGFGPGGALVEIVRFMRESVPPVTGVKASGGIRDTSTALAMVAAGATRLGTSSGVAIVTGAGGAGSASY